jgi:patatin-like phospholipase/acyl hydrolase
MTTKPPHLSMETVAADPREDVRSPADRPGVSSTDGDRFQILAFDGGGLKGLFAAALLADVEEQLDIRIADHFDLIAGTSTGGLIALGLGAGLRPAEIVDFYVNVGPKVFGRPRQLSRLWRPKHDEAGLRAALTDVFGDRRLGSSGKRLIIPAYSLDTDDVYVFKTRHHPRLTRDHTDLMVDVALATTAAPTYLPAARLRHQRLVDGGVWATNPTLIAVAEAVSMLAVPLDRIKVLSMGATDDLRDLRSRLADGGLGQWARPATNVLLHAQATGSFHAAEHLVGPDNVTRITEVVPDKVFRLDKLNPDRIRGLAAARARTACPEIRPFAQHRAAPFRPHPTETS